MPLPVVRDLTEPRRILHVDADAFFVAVARRVDPDGAGRANLLIVGGGGTRGVVCSASYETRAFGVRSAMPTARALRLCPGALVVPVPMAECAKISREIHGVLDGFTPLVQGASIDEWYLDMGGTEALYHGESLRDTAHRVRSAVQKATGLTVSIGGGTNRLVAKLAVERAKPKPGTGADGVFVVAPGDEADFVATLTLADLPMVGPRFRARLEAQGVHTIRQVLATPTSTLQRWLGARAGGWLEQRVRGIDASEVQHRGGPRSTGQEETFGSDIADDETLGRELVHLTTRVAHDLRRRGLMARTVTVKLRDHDFRTRNASRTLPHGVISDRILLATAHDLLARLRRARQVPARLLGVSLSGLDDADGEAQLTLFDDGTAEIETEKDRRLAHAVDAVRTKFGREAVLPGRVTGRRSRPR
jgi:DNA polymerase-4